MQLRTTCVYRRLTSHGYMIVRMPGHPRADPKGYVLEHVLLVAIANNRLLTRRAVIHHMDGNRANNAWWNLYVLTNQAEHNRVHGIERRRDPHQLELWVGIEYMWWAERSPWLPRMN